MIYPVNEVYATFQGEGRWTGTPVVLLRLQGCPVGCPFCDTKETWRLDRAWEKATPEEAFVVEKGGEPTPAWVSLSATEIAAYIRTKYKPMSIKWVMLTGGEPANYPLSSLTYALHDAGFQIMLETSGTADGHLNADIDWVTVSPKINMPGGKLVLKHVVAAADEIKFAVGKRTDINKLRELLRECPIKARTIISLQPISQSKRATRLCLTAAMNNGWNISIQTHKYVSVK